MSSFDPFWLPQFHTLPHHWTVSLAKHYQCSRKSNHRLECKAGSGSPLYLTMQKRYETEVTNLSQNNTSFFAVIYLRYHELAMFPSLQDIDSPSTSYTFLL